MFQSFETTRNIAFLYLFAVNVTLLLTIVFKLIKLQILRNRKLQSRSHRRQQTQGCDPTRGGRHFEVQEGQSDHVRLGNQGQAARRGHLQPGQRTQCQLH